MEGGWGVGQSEWHGLEFEEAVMISECCFPFIALPHSDEMKPDFEVHLCEPFCSLDAVL